MQYRRKPKYRLWVPNQPSIYFGRKPSALDYIRSNCTNVQIRLYEQIAQDQPEVLVYEAEIDEFSVPVRYSGLELERLRRKP